MKKIIGILGVGVFALTMLINTTKENDIDLASQIAINVAQANVSEPIDPDLDECSSEEWKWCVITFSNGHSHSFPDCEPDRWYTLADCM